jgi:NhaP-type Na+/H+ or K+/H+ antiporter
VHESADLATWNLVVGFLSATFVIPIIQQPRWSSSTRAAVTFVYSIIVGLATAYFSGAYHYLADGPAAVSSILTTLVAAIATYKGFAQPSGIAPMIEAATSPDPTTDRG